MTMLRITSAALSALIITGCSTIGSSEYGCSGLPEGVRCMSTSDVYDATNGGQMPKANKGEGAESGDTQQALIIDPVVDTFVTPNLPDRPIPIRTPARVMRIWVSSYEDTNSGALIAPGYIYTEIEPRRWVIGKPESTVRDSDSLFKPLGKSSNSSFKAK